MAMALAFVVQTMTQNDGLGHWRFRHTGENLNLFYSCVINTFMPIIKKRQEVYINANGTFALSPSFFSFLFFFEFYRQAGMLLVA